MKRISFKSYTLLSVVAVLSPLGAIAQNVPSALELLEKGENPVRQEIDAESFKNLGFILNFNGKSVQITHKEEIAEACIKRLELTLGTPDRPSDISDLEIKSTDDLNAISTKVPVKFAFIGVPAVKNFGDCQIATAKSPKTKLVITSKEILNDKEVALSSVADKDGKVVVKNAARSAEFVSREAKLASNDCVSGNCNETVVTEEKKKAEVEKKTVAKLTEESSDNSIKDLEEKLAAADSRADVEAIANQLELYSKEILESDISTEKKIEVQNAIHLIMTEALVEKLVELGTQVSPDLFTTSAKVPSAMQSSIWARFPGLLVEDAPTSKRQLSLAEAHTDAVANLMDRASKLKLISRKSRIHDLTIARELREDGDFRTQFIAQMDPNHPKVVAKRNLSIAELGFQPIRENGRIRQSLAQQHAALCSNGREQYNFMQCGIMLKTLASHEAFVKSDPRYAEIQSMNTLFSGQYGNQNTGNQSIQPMTLNQNVYQQPTSYQAYRGYQSFDPSSLYQSPGAWNNNSNATTTGNQQSGSLPVARPIVGLSFPNRI